MVEDDVNEAKTSVEEGINDMTEEDDYVEGMSTI